MRMLRLAEPFAELGEGCGIGIIAVHILQHAHEFGESLGIEAAIVFDAILRALFQLLKIPAGFGDANDRYVEVTALGKSLQSGKNLFVGQVAGGAEKD